MTDGADSDSRRVRKRKLNSRLQRGREFELCEKRDWLNLNNGTAQFKRRRNGRAAAAGSTFAFRSRIFPRRSS